MRNAGVFLALSTLVGLPLRAASPEQAVRQTLEAQQAAWNRGDVRAFMDGYEAADSTTFVGTSITRGWSKVLDRYLVRYPTRDAMGTLTFSGLEIQPLGNSYASVLGQWHLDRPADAGGPVGGYFTLLLHKTGKGWKIFLDHTS